MKLDLHIHSTFSEDGSQQPVDILKRAKAVGLDGVAITDHNSVQGGLAGVEAARDFPGLVVIPGIEITSSAGHILGLGITELVQRDLTPEKTVENIRALGGVAVVPHPYRFWSGVGQDVVRRVRFDAVEGVNARSNPEHNKAAQKLASELGLGTTGGSDAHSGESVGEAYTVVDGDGLSGDDILKAIRKGQTRGEGRSRSSGETAGYVYKSVSKWMKRGMKRM